MLELSRPISHLAADDRVVLFPTLGHREADGRWKLQVHGDVFAPGKIGLTKRILLKWLQRSMRAPDWALEEPLFHYRISRFLADDRRGKRIAVCIAGRTYQIPKKTDRNGHFQGVLRLPDSEVERALDMAGQVPVEVDLGQFGGVAHGAVQIVASQGISVISDIDDTLKHSGVGNRRTLLVNTFLRDFEPIPGMVELFQQWAADGAMFHYLSSSPWQLYTQLAEHFAEIGLPAGSFHLRAFRLRDQLLRRLLWMRRSGKGTALTALVKMFPLRRFILVGDSGELDPELYGTLARKFSRQIVRCLIRAIPGPKCTDKRFRRAFRQVDPRRWQVYHDPGELAPELTSVASGS